MRIALVFAIVLSIAGCGESKAVKGFREQVAMDRLSCDNGDQASCIDYSINRRRLDAYCANYPCGH